MTVATIEHQWIKLELSTVHVLPDEANDQEPVIFADPDEEVMIAYSCQLCGHDLNRMTIQMQCSGESDEEEGSGGS